ncbi:LysR family transcriptional regulator [Paracoccus aminophilus]|uniref:Transcriptional regulator, LysR family n=1 Tax=Paracoccus aminophilus JCM 7686 TaxID=1367847 RepID=S5Y0Z6_PARAH|nr:LysR family transcriptional regulator [Paracoccus aminophilus]AGT09385.1 transcriptional regulator, LysR family [Paracoccus aminophilus JCM 7686]
MRYSLDEMETFLTVMELGTVTAASDRLNLSKSVVSKRISDFETTLGAALFRRNAGRITPTEAALRLAERLRPALTELSAAAESAAWGMDGVSVLRGRLTISAPMSFGTIYLSPLIAEFAALHPELEIRLDYDDRARDLLSEGFDVALRVGELRDTALKARKLCEDQQIPCASPDYIATHGAPRDLQELSQHPVISYSHRSDTRLWEFHCNGRAVSAPVKSRLSMNNGEAIRDFVIAGLGLGMLPGFIVSPEIAKGRLVRILPGYAPRRVPISLVWPPVEPMPAKLRAFIDFIAAALHDGPPWALCPERED